MNTVKLSSTPHRPDQGTLNRLATASRDRELGRADTYSRSDEDTLNHPTTSRKELWSYYLYYNVSDNGVGIWTYSATLLQATLSGAGWDPTKIPVEKGNCTVGPCIVQWGSGTRSVSSIILIATGFVFATTSTVLLTLGSAADYGNYGHWLLLFFTLVQWAAQFGMVTIRQSKQWPAAMVFYVISYACYAITMVFYNAAFPRLARFVPHVRRARENDLKNGRISQEDYDLIESMERNHISNVSTAHSNIGYTLALVLSLAVLLPLHGKLWGNNLAILVTNIYAIVLGIWWLVFRQYRPGPRLPPGSNFLTISWKQVSVALVEIRQLPQTFLYMISVFLLADGIETTTTVVNILQAQVIEYSFLKLTYIGLVTSVCSTVSSFGFWYLQKHYNITTKRMYQITNVFSVLLPLYGMAGIWTSIGYKREVEFWLYGAVWGLTQAPYYAYIQALLSELTPKGYENLFFGLLGIANRGSSIIGPIVVQAITNATNNDWMSFPFLFAICALASILVMFIDVPKGREDCRKYVEARTSV